MMMMQVPLMSPLILRVVASLLVSVSVVNGQGVLIPSTFPPALSPAVGLASDVNLGGGGGVPIPPGYTLPPGTTWPPNFSLPPADSGSGGTIPPDATFPPVLQNEIEKQQELAEVAAACYDDPTLLRCDSCHIPSPLPNCFDKTCSKRICEQLNQTKCCDEEWDIQCATLANSICVPEIYPWENKLPCPLGFICEDNGKDPRRKANCTHIAQLTIDYQIGDLYGGLWCPKYEWSMKNCPKGHYCPSMNEKYKCPAGYYCHHRTKTPYIQCNNCEEGAKEMKHDTFGYFVCIIGLVVVLVVIGLSLIHKYKADEIAKQYNLLSRQASSFNISKRRKERQQQLERLRPKLDIIQQRLNSMEERSDMWHNAGGGNNNDNNSNKNGRFAPQQHRQASEGALPLGVPPLAGSAALAMVPPRLPGQSPITKETVAGTTEGGSVKFNARKIFDALDVDDSGDLSYDELNAVLGLNAHELQNFCRRMQELATAGTSSQSQSSPGGSRSTVTRPIFCRYFLQVLEETNRLTVTHEEAMDLYDTIAAENGRGGIVSEAMLYTSSLSQFLNDQQILTMIKKFRAVNPGGGASNYVSSARSGYDHSGDSVRSGNKTSTAFIRTSNRAGSPSSRPYVSSRVVSGFFGVRRAESSAAIKHSIPRSTFVEYYPQFLIDVTTNFDELRKTQSVKFNFGVEDDDDNDQAREASVDICFQELCLSVKVAGKSINVVDNVTGRIRERTMTALMGGSGAGKTSLLNALCGRAYYGDVSGKIYINGQLKDIKEIQDSVGFVPQDDIVYAELTVRENLIYTGKFLLPRGTPASEISELADETLASLGLSRVANSLVGDVKRRGVSGGEKKRVNIGLELMKRPACVFLDEPTSGLDASSALLVMQSLKHLVNVQGVTIVSVIHQPRKFIFDLFDSLILLGVGGRMVYHGPTSQAKDYFNGLDYVLPPGESVADWLIDISSGREERDVGIAKTKKEQITTDKTRKERLQSRVSMKPYVQKKQARKREGSLPEDVEVAETDGEIETQINFDDSEEDKLLGQGDNAVVTNGISAGKANDAFEEAKIRRAWLYEKWNEYFNNLSEEELSLYNVPKESRLPEPVRKQSFVSQLYNQVSRAFLVSWRNYVSKLIDTSILVIATIVLAVMTGFPKMTSNWDPDVEFEDIVRPSNETIPDTIGWLFRYVAFPRIEFPLKVGIIGAVLIGLQATKILTSKRIEFFREASSGYNINAYFVAVNIVSTVEHSIQAVIAAFFAAWLRDPVANWVSIFVHFVLLAWVCVSWALFIPMMVPPDNVTVIVGFFMAFCGLLISGAFPPTTYGKMYEEGGLTEHIPAWLSPTRWFYESLIVGDLRCFPEQTGLTVADESKNFDRDNTVMHNMGLAWHDPNSTQRSCDGWYFNVLPSILVGLTIRFAALLAMHSFNRPQQVKKPLLYEMKRDPKVAGLVVAMFFCLIALGSFTTWVYTREPEPNYETSEVPLGDIDYRSALVLGLLNQAGVPSHLFLDSGIDPEEFDLDQLNQTLFNETVFGN